MIIALILLAIAVVLLIAGYRRISLKQWTILLVGIMVAWSLYRLSCGCFGIFFWVGWGVTGLVALFNLDGLRHNLFIKPIFKLYRKLLPKMSDTEREALEAGTVWWDAEVFAGRPDWNKLLDAPKPKLSPREQAFIDGPVREVCAMANQFEINHVHRKLPDEIWQFLKEKGFFGMIISEDHGGLGFSVQAQSEVVSILSTRSIALAVTVMVPNSLGPGELLHRFGTKAQQDYYLPRLASGEEIPAFGLTGPYAGSDAASMRDTGIVCKGQFNGEEVIGFRLNWEKRYITLGPVCTVLGLAFQAYDPDGLLDGEDDLGITLALIPIDLPGVEIGRRHFPAGQAFQNGPNSGEDVFVPISYVIGEEEGIGNGWSMLMAALAAGRAISLPAQGVSGTKAAARLVSAYAQVRKQFNISIGRMEGVEEAIAQIAGQAYLLEAARNLTNTAIDMGEQPSIISAILKFEATNRMRDSITNAMDVLSGKGICVGPNNLMFDAHAAMPIAITVEGANILTRSLIIFAQGSIRCHPWLFKEMTAAQMTDEEEALESFEKALCGHISFIIGNFCGSLIHNMTAARFVPAPSKDQVSPRTRGWYKNLGRASQNYALLSDLTLLLLGGAVKRKQRITARFADALGELYLMSAALKRFEDDGRPEEDLIFVKWAMANGLARIQDSYEAILQNFPNRPLAWLLRWVVFPYGRRFEPVRDKLERDMVRAILKPGEVRDRLTRGVYIPDDPTDPMAILEDTFKDSERADSIWKKMRQSEKAGTIKRGYGPDHYISANNKAVISADERDFLIAYEEKVRKVIDVDDFTSAQIESGFTKKGKRK